MSRKLSFLPVAVLAFVAGVLAFETSVAASPDLRLYRLDCGRFHIDSKDIFSDTDDFPGQTLDIVGSCYLIKHDAEWLLWDTGLPAAIGDNPEGQQNGPFHMSVDTSLVSQLLQLELTPANINYVGVSHGHFDHTGNVNLFQNAELIIQQAEYDFFANPELARAYHMEPKMIEFFLNGQGKSNVRKLTGDGDIFGDGSVVALSLPGHTPGHMALKVQLPEAGAVFLSGDQWHFDDNHKNNGVPDFNYDRADTLSSSDRLNRLIANTRGRLIIQHEPAHSVSMPAIPGFLE